jgi:hypothetical protein
MALVQYQQITGDGLDNAPGPPLRWGLPDRPFAGFADPRADETDKARRAKLGVGIAARGSGDPHDSRPGGRRHTCFLGKEDEPGGKMNREWHEQHKIPQGATQEERIAWHMEHARHCACRPIPEGLIAKMSHAQKREAAKVARPEKPVLL